MSTPAANYKWWNGSIFHHWKIGATSYPIMGRDVIQLFCENYYSLFVMKGEFLFLARVYFFVTKKVSKKFFFCGSFWNLFFHLFPKFRKLAFGSNSSKFLRKLHGQIRKISPIKETKFSETNLLFSLYISYVRILIYLRISLRRAPR